MGRDTYMDQSEELRMAYTKSACLELLALSENYRQVMPQVLELVRGYYAAKKACFFEYEEYENEENTGKNTRISNINPYIDLKNLPDYAEKTQLLCRYMPYVTRQFDQITPLNTEGMLTAPSFYGKAKTGILLVEERQENQEDGTLLFEIGRVLAAEIQKYRYQEYLRRLSFSDQLTGVKNHASYVSVRKSMYEHPVRAGVGFADLNGLKYVNDTFGHEYGDKVLVHLANVMKDYFPKDQIYRISGDEFIVLCPDIEYEAFLDCAEKLKDRLKQEENGLAAFGYVWNDADRSLAELLRCAEQNMYDEKCLYYQHNERRETARPLYADKLE